MRNATHITRPSAPLAPCNATRTTARATAPGSARLMAIALAAACTLSVVAAPAAARDHGSTVTGGQGQSASRNVSRANGDASTTTTGPKGKTASRNVDRSAAGATATSTGPNGNSATRTTTPTGSGTSTTMSRSGGQSGTVTTTR